MKIPMEDNFADLIGKAQRGLGLSDSVVAERTGLTPQAIHGLRDGKLDENALKLAAPVLGLDAKALIALGRGEYKPEVAEIDGLAQFNTPFEDITVNSYLAWDVESKEAVAFDTGSDCTDLLAKIRTLGLKLGTLLLTHTHGDHIVDIDRLCEKTGARAYVCDREPLEGAESIEPGREFSAGALKIGSRLTRGHSAGGLTYVIHGLAMPVAIVGDALFAGSMGGGVVSYQDALRTNRAEIFSLPDDTIVCPGHGPMTTVGQEWVGNAFFAGR